MSCLVILKVNYSSRQTLYNDRAFTCSSPRNNDYMRETMGTSTTVCSSSVNLLKSRRAELSCKSSFLAFRWSSKIFIWAYEYFCFDCFFCFSVLEASTLVSTTVSLDISLLEGASQLEVVSGNLSSRSLSSETTNKQSIIYSHYTGSLCIAISDHSFSNTLPF